MQGHLGALIPGQREPGCLGQPGQDPGQLVAKRLGIVAGGQVDQAQRPARCRAGGSRVRTRSRPGAAAARDSKHQRRRHRTSGCHPPPPGRTGGPRSSGGQGDLRFPGVMFCHAGDSGLVQDLQSDVGKPGVLVRVDDDVAGTGVAVRSSPSQTNSAEIPYPSPASIVRAAVSRIRTRSSAISRSGCFAAVTALARHPAGRTRARPGSPPRREPGWAASLRVQAPGQVVTGSRPCWPLTSCPAATSSSWRTGLDEASTWAASASTRRQLPKSLDSAIAASAQAFWLAARPGGHQPTGPCPITIRHRSRPTHGHTEGSICVAPC